MTGPRLPYPPLEEPLSAPGLTRWALLVALGLLGIHLRRRPLAAGLTGAGGATLLLVLGTPGSMTGAPGGSGASAVVLQADESLESWRFVEASLYELEILGLDPVPILRVQPGDAELTWQTELGDSGMTGGSRWTLSASTARIYRQGEAGPVASVFPETAADGRPVNHWGRLEACWVRTTSGSWHTLGAWEPGEPRPAPLESGPASGSASGSASGPEPGPPGWLASGLPQGVPVVLGRFEPGSTRLAEAVLAKSRSGTAQEGPVYLRILGL